VAGALLTSVRVGQDKTVEIVPLWRAGDDHLHQARQCAESGERLTPQVVSPERQPCSGCVVVAMLPDGSRLHVVIPDITCR
jgi:hypothetical protein